MARIQWKIRELPWRLKMIMGTFISWIKLLHMTLYYNHFTSFSVALETSLEPVFWFVDKFAKYLGPIFMTMVIFLTTSVVAIFYTCLLPHVYAQSTSRTIFHLVFGHWLLINIVFNYIMAAFTNPGTPPIEIPETVSICRKCIAPKPPRTHHCSVCDKCILKMDHHCPWLNNCVGFYTHRFFFLFCCYMFCGALYVCFTGYDVFTEHFYGKTPYPFPAVLYPLNLAYDVINKTLTSTTPMAHSNYNLEVTHERQNYHLAVIFEFLVCSAVAIAILGLILWHFRMISRGETNIEIHINKKERERLKKQGIAFRNPYDFGFVENWRIFFGIEKGTGRSFVRHILFPSSHQPTGDGLTWPHEIYRGDRVLQLL
ncbi:palmitoyltransferase ZDHHC16B-like [Pecten maximus]|uniref:palmitoyltransferase ZDHHC16B-like n=1 Tax=Pecten maximus TaxID=6579 RepID=UPI00145846A9|nr:palmitoyltransferase ZDHHC16B-like [Pecten maximus]